MNEIIPVDDNKDDKKDLIQQKSDLEFSREQYIDLINNNREAVSLAMQLARETESPRVFEILGQLLKSSAEITDKLVDLHKSKKILSQQQHQKEESKNNTTNTTNNNAIFVGSTTELQKIIKNNSVNPVNPSIMLSSLANNNNSDDDSDE